MMRAWMFVAMVVSGVGCLAGPGSTSAADAPREDGEKPGWYVRRTTAKATYEASRQQRDRRLGFTLGPWYYAGPFDNSSQRGFRTEYPPEKGVDLAASYSGKDGITVRWKRGEQFQDGQANSLLLFPHNDNIAVYLYRTIHSDAAQHLPVLLGSDDTLTVWLNGKRLLAVEANRVARLGDDRAVLPLRQGENHLLMKVCQGGGPAGFAFGLSAHDDLESELFQALAEDFPGEAQRLRLEIVRQEEPARQFRHLRGDLTRRNWFSGVARHAYRPEALILPGDRDPLDVVLRRTTALLERLKQTAAATRLEPMAQDLGRLAAKAGSVAASRADDRYALYLEACRLRRRIALANPLLDFDKILFVKRHFLPPSEGLGNHMCDQYFGFHAIPGGGVYVLDRAFGDEPVCRDLLGDKVATDGRFEGRPLVGAFLSPALSYDAQSVVFAFTEAEPTRYQWTERSTWHLFKVQVNGSGLTQLTDGPVNDFHPCYLPSGRVVFISERRGGYGRCHGRPVPTYTLHTMQDDGSDITCISHHETNEWHPSVNHDGMIVYTRWDYVDRGHGQAHHPWITTPDGRDARAIQGNYGRGGARPNMEMDVRAIPGSRHYVTTATGHHAQAYGSLVILAPEIPDDDGMGPLRMLTPEVGFPEATIGSGDGQMYATAWPLDDDFFLCVYDGDGCTQRGVNNRFGIYLIDSFGNKELLYCDPEISCLSPIPLKPRPRPPVLPELAKLSLPRTASGTEAAAEMPATAKVGVMNVYDSTRPWPTGTRIKALRIVQVLPKTTPSADSPRIGYGEQKNARKVLGTVPVRSDGSALFHLPVGVPVYFQALDEKGLAVQSMRSDTYVQPGETLLCQGCHAPTPVTASLGKSIPKALQREPARITPDVEGSNPLSYARLVQPVLDRHCVECHAKPPARSLSKGTWETNPSFWYTSYINLRPYAFFIEPAGWTEPRTTPGRFGAKASKLYQLLAQGHYGVKLSDEEMHRITLWLDCNSDFFGSYEQTREQAEGQVVQPRLE